MILVCSIENNALKMKNWKFLKKSQLVEDGYDFEILVFIADSSMLYIMF